MKKNLGKWKFIILGICCCIIVTSIFIFKNKKVDASTAGSIENLLQEFFSLEFSKEPVDCSNLVKNDNLKELYNFKLNSLVEFNINNNINDYSIGINNLEINKASNNTFEIKFTLDKVFFISGKESSEKDTEYLATIKNFDDNFFIEKITDTKSYKEFLESKNKHLKVKCLEDSIYDEFIKEELKLRENLKK